MLPAIEKETSAVSRAIKWLDTVTDPDGGIHRWLNLDTGELGPVSTEITGYAAHLFAWLAMEKDSEEYRQRAIQHAMWIDGLLVDNNYEFLPFEPGSDLSYYFDCGIAARGLEMVELVDPIDWVSGCISESMSRNHLGGVRPIVDRTLQRVNVKPGWWSSEQGMYQQKAKLAERYGNAVDYLAFPELQWTEWNGDGNLLHPMAYFVEAAYLSGNKLVAAMGTEMLDRYLQGDLYGCRFSRTDAYAQWFRLATLQGGDTFGAVDILLDRQHDTGGFHFATQVGHLSPDLSTHATIFAIQALMMAEGHTTDYKELTIV